jgi:hypothetical protein
MSERSNDYRSLLVAGAVLVVGAWFMAFLVQKGQEPEVRSTYSYHARGTSAFYELTAQLGQPLQRIERGWQPEELRKYRTIMVLHPVLAPDEGEWKALEQWVSEGGSLAIAPDFGVTGAKLAQQSNGAVNWRTAFGSPRESQKLEPSTIGEDVERVCFESTSTITDKTVAATGCEQIFQDDEGVRITSLAFGEGRIVVLADDSFLSNGLIDKVDNAILATRLIEYLRESGGKIGYDETHQGVRGERKPGPIWVLGKALMQTGAGHRR